MELFRIHAYEVQPQRLESGLAPRGGALATDAALKKALQEYLAKSGLLTQSTVDLRRGRPANGSSQPTHELRSHVLNYCFGQPASAKAASLAMATKLAKSMDKRSAFSLLLLAAYQENAHRQLVLWAFPKDEPFGFSVSGERARIRILTDAFSRSSSFKKGALFRGTNHPESFWSSHVIDKQADNGFGSAADYWVSRFLEATASLSGKAGTRMLASCLRRTHDGTSDQVQRDQICEAILGVRASQRSKWSLATFAKEYLKNGLKEQFLANAPSELLTAKFSFDRVEFDQKLNFRVFKLEDNVVVSAPFGTVGRSVKLEDGAQTRRLKCEGVIVAEKVRAQHVG